MTALEILHVAGRLTILAYILVGGGFLIWGAGTERGSAFLGGYLLGSTLLGVGCWLIYGVTV